MHEASRGPFLRIAKIFWIAPAVFETRRHRAQYLAFVRLSRRYRQFFSAFRYSAAQTAVQQLRWSAICAVTLRFGRVIQLTRWRHAPHRPSVIRRTLKKSAPAACRHDHMIRGHCLQIPEESHTPHLHRSSDEMLRQTRAKVKTCRRTSFKLSRGPGRQLPGLEKLFSSFEIACDRFIARVEQARQ